MGDDHYALLSLTYSHSLSISHAEARTVDRTRARLEQLEMPGAVQKLYISQQDYIKHLESIHENLHAAWEAQDRVRSIKLVIQAAKLLGETDTPQFYPSMFMLVSTVLDSFGRMVYDRIYERASKGDDGMASLSMFLGEGMCSWSMASSPYRIYRRFFRTH